MREDPYNCQIKLSDGCGEFLTIFSAVPPLQFSLTGTKLNKTATTALRGFCMKRSFSFSDINRLIDDYRKAEQRQREISEVGEYESEVRKAAVRYVDSEAMAMMEDIAVEELNRDRKGIRVKALRDHGYNNYADILTARDFDLSAVRGISEDTAYKIMKCVEDVYGQAKESVRLKLNADDRSVSATRIVTALSRYHEACKLASDCEGLDDKYRSPSRVTWTTSSLQRGFSAGCFHPGRGSRGQRTHISHLPKPFRANTVFSLENSRTAAEI